MAIGFVRRKRFLITIGVIAAAVVSLFLAFRLGPWPGALLIRQVFENDANDVLKEMVTHAPANVASILNERCRAGDGDAYLDVSFPASSDKARVFLPTVIWAHGGAWISGSKDQDVPCFHLLTSWVAIVAH